LVVNSAAKAAVTNTHYFPRLLWAPDTTLFFERRTIPQHLFSTSLWAKKIRKLTFDPTPTSHVGRRLVNFRSRYGAARKSDSIEESCTGTRQYV
jgi:hypothetical protein